ncbi:MAG: hypothetical protein ACYCV6_00620 [Steroidobacteraceae bacterium]
MPSINLKLSGKVRRHPPSWRGLTTALMALAGGLPAAALAQTRYSLAPSVAVGGMYDDNVFETATQRRADGLVRVSPVLAGSLRSPKLDLSGFVSVDMERHDPCGPLDSPQTRKSGGLYVEYRPTQRLGLEPAGRRI